MYNQKLIPNVFLSLQKRHCVVVWVVRGAQGQHCSAGVAEAVVATTDMAGVDSAGIRVCSGMSRTGEQRTCRFMARGLNYDNHRVCPHNSAHPYTSRQ